MCRYQFGKHIYFFVMIFDRYLGGRGGGPGGKGRGPGGGGGEGVLGGKGRGSKHAEKFLTLRRNIWTAP